MLKTCKWVSYVLVLSLILTSIFIVSPLKVSAVDIPCIPGIKGFGVNTSGGRGGTIIHVTNLNDSGTGSLREACGTSGARIIVFDVSGTIDLGGSGGGDIRINNPFITIAGQTAPAPGIQLKGGTLKISTNNVVIQHIAIRYGNLPGPDLGDSFAKDRDGIKMARDGVNDIYNVVMDHISTAWSTDEAGQLWNNSSLTNVGRFHDVTITNCLLAEPLRFSGRADAIEDGGGYPNYPNGHEFGILVGDSCKNISLIGNYVSGTQTRCPTLKANTSSFIANNLFYNNSWNWCMLGSSATEAGNAAGPLLATYIGNSYVNGPDSSVNSTIFHYSPEVWYTLNPSASKIFFDSSNYYECQLKVNDTTDPNYFPPALLSTTTQPVTISGFTALLSNQVETYIKANAGARPAFRDSVDLRAINQLITRTGQRVDSQDEVGGWPTYAYNYVPFVAPANPQGDDDGDGYTNIEEEFQRLAAIVEGKSSTGYQAEYATLYHGTVANNLAGYTGTGFVDYTNEIGSYVEFTVNTVQAGSHTLDFRFMHNSGADRPMEIKVNGAVVNSSLSFPDTGSWTTWATQSLSTNLNAGNNTIRATAILSTGGPNLDKLDISANTSAYLVNDSFDGMVTGSAPTGWTLTPTDGTIAVAEIPSATDKSMRITRTGTGSTSTKAVKAFAQRSGVTTIEYELRVDSTKYFCVPYIYDSSGNMAISIQTGGGYIRHYTGGTWSNIQLVSNNQFYTVKIVLDTNTDKYDLYIDGTKKVNQAAFRTAVSNIASLSFYLDSTNPGSIYVDNVKVIPITTAYLVNDNFDGMVTSSAPTGWTLTPTDGTIAVAEIPSATDKSMKITRTGTGSTSTKAVKSFAQRSGVTTIEYELRVDSTKYFCVPYIYDSSGNIIISIQTGGGYFRHYTGGTWYNIQEVSNYQFYTVKVVLDTDTDKYDLYIDGTKLVNQAAFRTTATNIASLSFYLDGANPGTVYVDNVKVSYTSL